MAITINPEDYTQETYDKYVSEMTVLDARADGFDVGSAWAHECDLPDGATRVLESVRTADRCASTRVGNARTAFIMGFEAGRAYHAG